MNEDPRLYTHGLVFLNFLGLTVVIFICTFLLDKLSFSYFNYLHVCDTIAILSLVICFLEFAYMAKILIESRENESKDLNEK